MAKSKVKVSVLDAVVDGKGKGAKLEIDERSARYLESIGYVTIQAVAEDEEPKPKEQRKKEADKPKGKAKSAKKKSDK